MRKASNEERGLVWEHESYYFFPMNFTFFRLNLQVCSEKRELSCVITNDQALDNSGKSFLFYYTGCEVFMVSRKFSS